MRRSPGKAPKLAGNSATPVAGLLPVRDRLLIVSCLVAITTLAWSYLLYLDHQMVSVIGSDTMMAGMGMSSEMAWAATDLFVAFAMWVVMMVGMMLPAVAPVVLVFAGAHVRRGGRRLPLRVLLFGLGYVAVWIGFSACAALVQWALHDAALLSPTATVSSLQVAGAILIVVGIYQLTPLKRACLVHCQSPLGFLMTRWRDGRLGALQMGVRHGAYCLGCCWALMVVLFVVGVMNLVWVAGLALLVLLEKLGPAGALVARVAGAAMMVVGLLFFVGAP